MKSVAESDFRKSSGLYINNSDGVLLLVKLQAFTVNDSERVNDRICFYLQAVVGLLLVKPPGFYYK